MDRIDRMVIRELAKSRRILKAQEQKLKAPKTEKPVKPDPKPELDMSKVLLLREAEVSLRKIGKEFDCSGQHVLNSINRFGQLNP